MKFLTLSMLIIINQGCIFVEETANRTPGSSEPDPAAQTKEPVQETTTSDTNSDALKLSTSAKKFVAVGASGDIEVVVELQEGISQVEDLEFTFSDNAFSFKGGPFPGAGGTCTIPLTASCSLVISFTPTSIAKVTANFTISYTVDGESASTSFGLEAEGSFIIGQPDTSTSVNIKEGFGTVKGVGTDGTRLFVAETGGHRVLIYNTPPTSSSQDPDVILGQPNRSSAISNSGGLSAKSLYSPHAVIECAGKLVVADSANNRVLIWNNVPSSDSAAASVVLGQQNFEENDANSGGVSASSLNNPRALWCESDTKLLVADTTNDRVLIWNSMPTANFAAADVVIGQTSMTSIEDDDTEGESSSTLDYPTGLVVVGTKLLIAEEGNHRVTIFSSIPTSNGAAAANVIGQALFTTSSSNNGGRDDGALKSPAGFATDGTKLIISDRNNHRALIFNSVPTTDNASSDYVIGQPDMTSGSKNNGGRDDATLADPRGGVVIGSKLYLPDSTNHRLLIFNSIPTSDSASADVVFGQPAPSLGSKYTVATNATQANGHHAYAADDKLIIADRDAHRVLLWTSMPTSNNEAPDYVLGQTGFSQQLINRGGAASYGTMDSPFAGYFDGTKFYVADTGNNRVLIWNSLPTSDGQAADVVVGQTNDSGTASNAGGRSAATLKDPRGLVVAGTKLIIADTYNNRILIYNTIPTSDGASANVVLGQTNFTSGSANAGGRSGSTLSKPDSIFTDGTRLVVGDRENDRVLIWNTIPTTDGQSADIVVGLPDMTTPGSDGAGANMMNNPSMPYIHNGALYVVDRGNARILKWNTLPATNGVAADKVYGQGDFDSTDDYAGLRIYGGTGFADPYSISFDGNKMIVGDLGARRTLILPSF